MTAATIAESCSRRGQGVHRPEDVEDIQAWRAEIRRKRRPDRIKVRTDFNDGIALPCGSERTGLSRMPKCGTSATALANGSAGHPTKAQSSLALRDGHEVICACGLAVRSAMGAPPRTWNGAPQVEGGCPNEEPPTLTAVMMMQAACSRWPPDSAGGHIDV
jgi:hypothetical protein